MLGLDPEIARQYGQALSRFGQMLGTILLGLLLGWGAQKLNWVTNPTGILVGVLLGTVLGIWNLIQQFRRDA